MGDVVKFPQSAYKLNPEEEQRLAESSAFTPEFKEKHKCPDPYCETIEVSKLEHQELQESAASFSMYYGRYTKMECDLRELKRMSLWDRIFNWQYKEKDDA